MDGMKNLYKILFERHERKRPVGIPWRSWEDNMGTDVREIWWKGMDRILLSQDRDHWRSLVNTVKNLRVL
jgi:hypothetical protein